MIFMHKLTDNQKLIKPKNVNTRLQDGPFFYTYKPNNERAKASVLYRGAIGWNAMDAKLRNLYMSSSRYIKERNYVNVIQRLNNND